MMWKLPVIPLLLIATAVLVPNTAWATHYTYWQENPEDQERWAGAYKFNAVAQTWSAGPYDTKWAHDGMFPERARAAIQSWEDAVPELSFSEVSSGYHLYFMKGYCGLWTDACLYRIRTTANATHQANCETPRTLIQ